MAWMDSKGVRPSLLMADKEFVPSPMVTKQVRNGIAYFTLHWSPLQKVEKYTIINSVPAEAGIFELYYLDDAKKLVLMRVSRVWYGGLRSSLRSIVDPDVEKDHAYRKILNERVCYFRYTVIRSADDMDDVLYFFAGRYAPRQSEVTHSGRYGEIYLEEKSPNRITTTGSPRTERKRE